MWITFYHQSKRFRRTLNLDDTKANRKFATQQIIHEIQYKLNNRVFFETEAKQKNKIPTVEEFSSVSFEIHKHERRELTQAKYLRLYAIHIAPTFKNERLNNIKPSALAKWQNKLLETLSTKTVKGVRTVFNTMFDDALKDELITKNPFTHIKRPINVDVIEKNPFSLEEIFSILKEMPESMRAFFAIGFYTGMRTGEIIGLKWSDINFKELTIHVQRSRRQGIESLPKTKNSIREIDIIEPLLPYLLKHKELEVSEEYIFETYAGKPFNTSDKISAHYWKPTLKKLGIAYRNLYQMRHTFASMMISNGEDILWVSNMLGHKDSSMTLQVYARYIKQTKRKRASFILEVA